MLERQYQPLVTVAVLSFEQETLIGACIRSVCSQDYENIELLICDDGSTAFNAAEIERLIEAYRSRNIVSWTVLHGEENLGTVQNCNRAIAHASGEYIKFLAADDLLYDETALSELCAHFHDTSIQVVAGRGLVAGDSRDGETILPTDMEFARLYAADADQMYALLCSRPWSAVLAPAAMFRLSCLKAAGGFDTAYRYLEDWPLWIKLSRQGIRIHSVPNLVVRYSLDGISSVSGRSKRDSQVRRQYLRECRTVLETEYRACQRGGSHILALKCLLSARCIVRRERRLACGEKGCPPRSLWDGPALLYQKIAGGLGNQRRIPLWQLAALAGGAAACLVLGWTFPLAPLVAALSVFGGWDIFLYAMKRKFKIENEVR